MKIAELQKYMIDRLTENGMEQAEAASVARILLSHKLNVSLPELAVTRELLEPADIEAEMERLLAGEPLQYVIGETEFMGLILRCAPSALIPRGDSEAVAEAAIELVKDLPHPRIADICTGSGAYALALADALPGAELFAVDISAAALSLARENAERLKLAERVRFYEGDLLEPLLRQGIICDMLVSNPPYIPSDELVRLPREVQREPAVALDGGADGLFFYRRLAADAAKALREGGWLVVEHGCDQAAAVIGIMETAGLIFVRKIKDLGGRDRGIICRR